MLNESVEERGRYVLKAVVQEFTVSGIPIASRHLAERHFAGLSAATIRNELAGLVETGYLFQPHVSAGRMPTDKGYRFFVDYLMDEEPVPEALKLLVREQLGVADPDLQSIVERAVVLLAALTDSAALVTLPRGRAAQIRHVDLVQLGPTKALLVLILQGNVISRHLVQFLAEVDQDGLTHLANRLSHLCQGWVMADVRAHLQAEIEADGLAVTVLEQMDSALSRLESTLPQTVLHGGVSNLAKQPELVDGGRLSEVLEVLEQSRYLAHWLSDLVLTAPIRVVIGTENSWEQLRCCTLVLAAYRWGKGTQGTLGIMGPTRMRYGVAVGRLRFVAQATGERLQLLSA